MGTYRVPRNTKGESRILIIFSTKALIFTIVGLVIGYLINLLLKSLGISGVGIVIMVVLALIGFTVATLKIPNINAIKVTHDTAGESIDEIILKYVKHRKNKNRIYISGTKEEVKNGK